MRNQSIRWGTLSAVYAQDGHPVADVIDKYGGVYTAVRFLTLDIPRAFAGKDAFLAQDVALLFADDSPFPYILGPVNRTATTEASLPEAYEDYTQTDPLDYVVQRGDTVLNVSGKAGVTLQAGLQTPIRLQTPSGGRGPRISYDGEADESLLLANRSIAYLTGFSDAMEQLRGAVQELHAWAQTVQHPPFVPANVLPEPYDPPGQELVSSLVSISAKDMSI